MGGDDEAAGPRRPAVGERVGSFRLEALVRSTVDTAMYRARDEGVARSVLLRITGEAGAASLLEDARRVAAVSHPGLVTVLEAGRIDTGAYAAMSEVGALPLSEAASLSSERAARVALDVAGAVEALAKVGLRPTIDATTVLIAETHSGTRGLLDPLRCVPSGGSCLADADRVASTSDLASLAESVAAAPSDALRSAIDDVRSGVTNGPVEFARAFAPLAAPRLEAGRPRRKRGPLIAGASLAAVVAAVGIAYELSRGSTHSASAREAPTARLVARIPLGLRGSEIAVALSVSGHAVWIATSTGRLMRVDTVRNAVVGRPVKLAGKHSIWDMAESGGSLFISDDEGWLTRVDPRTGRATASRRLGGRLTRVVAANDVLWVASREGSKGVMRRIAPRTLRAIGRPIQVAPEPSDVDVDVDGSRAWVIGNDGGRAQATRIDVRSRTTVNAYVGDQATTATLSRGTLWINDLFNGTLSPLDAERMAFAGPALVLRRSTESVVAVDNDLWIVAGSNGSQVGRLRVERFDARSGRRAGRPVAIGSGFAFQITLASGSLWVLTPTNLMRLVPTRPRPSLAEPAPATTSPRPYTPGPLAAGSWRTTTFAAPFTFTTPAFSWFAMVPETDSVTLLGVGRRGRPVEIDVDAPRQVFRADGSVHTVTSASDLLASLRSNPDLKVTRVHRFMLGARSAVRFQVHARHLRKHPEVCRSLPCVLLFPLKEGTLWLAGSDVNHFTLLEGGGRPIIIGDSGTASERTILNSLRFRP